METRKSLLSCALLLCFALCCVSAEKFSAPQLKKLQKMAKDSPVIKFNADTYKTYVTETERNYTVFMLFTATHHKYKCGPCRQLAESFQVFGDSYARQYNSDYNSVEFLSKPFFLGQLEPDDGMDVFQGYGFQTVPHFAVIHPGKKTTLSIPESDFFRNTGAKPEDFSQYVQEKIDVSVEIYYSPVPRLMAVGAFLLLAAAMARLGFVVRKRLQDPMVWFVITMGLYFIVMAGIAYNFIRSPPYSDTNPNTGEVTYIAPQARSQYVAEGLIIATLMTGTGILIVAIGDLIPYMRSAINQRILFWICSLALFICLVSLNNIFFAKYHLPAFRLHNIAGFLGR